jgi:hypothetical protein
LWESIEYVGSSVEASDPGAVAVAGTVAAAGTTAVEYGESHLTE